MPRKKKDINIDIDTKNVDVKVTRHEDVLDASLDTKNIDIKIHKQKGKKIDIDIDTTPEFGEKVVKVIGEAIRKVISRRG